MRGHIAKKGNRYYAVIYEGIDPATGKPRHRWHSAGDTWKGAEKILGELIKRMHDGDYRSPDKVTLGDYLLERWLPSKRTRVKALTAAGTRTARASITHTSSRSSNGHLGQPGPRSHLHTLRADR